MSCHHANKIRWTQNNSVSVFTLDLCSLLLQLWLPQTEKHLSPWLLIILTKSRQHASLLYSQPVLLRAMMRVRANSNQLIFYSTRVPVFVAFASWNCVKMQLYNTGPVTLSSTSLPFILLLCEQTAVGLFFFFLKQQLSLQQPRGTKATLQITDGSLSSRVRTRDEITLGIWAQGWSGGGWLLDDKHTEAHICAHNRVQKDMTQNNTSICVLSSFRLSGLVIVLILGHIYTPQFCHILSKTYAHSSD